MQVHDGGARLGGADGGIGVSVTGRCGDMEGVWIEPVTAQVMMTLRFVAIADSLCFYDPISRAALRL
jgi:hypothetical protein